jgi:hypothetical protein
MKKLFVAVSVFLCCLASPSARAVAVAPGSPLILSFSNLAFAGKIDNCCQAGASVHLVGDLLDSGDNIRMELFDDSTDIFFAQDFNKDTVFTPLPTDQFGGGIAAGPLPAWQDLQGSVVLTALSGSINVDSITAFTIRGRDQINDLFSQTFDFPSVPLPAALPLFATGLGALGLLGWRRKRKAALP